MSKSGMPEFVCGRLHKDTPSGSYRCGPCDPEEGDKGCGATIALPGICELLSDKMAKEQEKLKRDIRQAREQGSAMLALGAGISVPMKMPNWTGLLSRMSGYAVQYRNYIGVEATGMATSTDKAHLRRLEDELIAGKIEMLNGINALEAAQYISLTLGREPGSMRDGLIKSVISEIIVGNTSPEKFKKSDDCPTVLKDRFKKKKKRWNKGEKAALCTLAKSNTLIAVAYILQAKDGFRRALTYNYDTLVQEYLIDFLEVPAKRVVTHSEKWTSVPKGVDDPIELLHVHGCLPRSKLCGQSPAFPEESQRLVLSEDSYYDMERGGAYDWQSSVQSYHFNRDTCVFVGFSAEDYNFRRILRQMGTYESTERPEHYLILTIDGLAKDIYASICRSRLKRGLNCDELREDAKVLLNQELAMKAEYWGQYNFRPIWATVNDVPGILMSLI